MHRSVRRIAIAAASTSIVLAGGTLAQAAPSGTAAFDAPIFGTTATLTEARMPTYAQVTCSDARCTRGVIVGAEGGATAYISTSIARGGVFAESPFFIAKLNKSWFGQSSHRSDDYSTFTINLAQVASGTDAAALIAADAAKYNGTVEPPVTADGMTSWAASGEFNDARWVVSYVAGGDALARGTCLQYGTEQGSVTCAPGNVRALTMATVAAPAPAQLADTASIAGLVPTTPRLLDPQLLNIEPTAPLWAPNEPTEALSRSLAARRNAVSLQYGVVGHPSLLFTAKVAALRTEAPARSWSSSVCESTTSTTRTCALSRLTGRAFGYIGAWSMRNPAEGTSSLALHATGGRRLGEAQCSVPGTIGTARALTADEIRACRGALTAFASAMAASR